MCATYKSDSSPIRERVQVRFYQLVQLGIYSLQLLVARGSWSYLHGRTQTPMDREGRSAMCT